MRSDCEAIQSNFECEPVEQLEMEVDDIVINDSDDSDIKSTDNDLCPIANDPYKSAESKHFDKGTRPPHSEMDSFFRNELKHFANFVESEVNLFSGMVKPMPLIDENARTDADDIEPLEQVIDLNPSHVLPSVDENAVDSMDFENQLG